jgi:Glycosyl hydrolases family 15
VPGRSHRRLEDRVPRLEWRRDAERELVRAVGAHPRVGLAQLVVPGLDPPQEAAARGHELAAAPHDLAIELDLVEGPRPKRQVGYATGMDAAPARIHPRVDPPPRLAFREPPAESRNSDSPSCVRRSFWLVSCLAQAGELDRAEALFDQLVGYANDLGLLAEEIDTASGEQLGNFPQAFSHIGLITAANAIDEAQGESA